MVRKAENVRSIERAIDVLECIASDRRPVSIGEIEKRVKLSRPTLYRILSSLNRRAFVRKDGDPPRYRLDIGAGRLAEAWTNSLEIIPLATPLMQSLVDRFDETVALYLRRGGSRFCVAEIPSRQALSYSRGLGHSGTIFRGASGLAMLAFLNEDDARESIAKHSGIAQKRSFQRTLLKIRELGYSVSSGEFIEGAQAIASPVFDQRGEVVASLGLFGPSVRFPAKRITECASAVRQSASRLSTLLGHR
jgi:IclR family transcriptional regulator, acetate operon repressor